MIGLLTVMPRHQKTEASFLWCQFVFILHVISNFNIMQGKFDRPQ